MDGEKPGTSKAAVAEAAALNLGMLRPNRPPHISKIVKNVSIQIF